MEKNYIFLDSNIFIQNFLLDNSLFQALFTATIRSNYQLVISDAVLLEVSNKYKKVINNIHPKLNNFGGDLSLEILNINHLSEEDSDHLDEKYKEFFRKYLLRNQINHMYLDLPNTPHIFLFRKAMEGKKPFHDSGGDGGGYRDALIWESVKELLSRGDVEKVYFVSENRHDFEDTKNQNSLHSDLIYDLSLGQLDSSKIVYFNSFNNFIKTIIIPTLDILNSIKQQLEKESYQQLNLSDFIKERLIPEFEYKDLDYIDDLPIPSYFENPTLATIDEIEAINNIEVNKLFTSKLLITFTITSDILIDFYIEKSNYYSIEERESFYDLDRNWNEWYVYASKYFNANLGINLIFDPTTSEVEKMDLESLVINHPVSH